MNLLLILPVIVPMLTAILGLFGRHSRTLQRSFAIVGTLILLVVSLLLLLTVIDDGLITMHMGSWAPPFGIVFVADLFSAIMVVMSSLIGLTVVVFSLANVDEQRRRFGYYPVIMVLLMGVNGAFLTGDMFNLYVWFEVMLIASFVLMALGDERPQLEGALKYFTLNLVGSSIFLLADGMLYGLTGTLNMADLAANIDKVQQAGMVPVLAGMFLVAFGIKAAIFPLYFWLPSSYHTPPIAVTTLFSGLMTKVGVYTLVRMFTLIFTQEQDFFHTLFLVIAGFTMVIGVLGAVAQYDVRRLLSFHIISQIGYLIMGLGIFTVTSLAGTIYFLIHVIIAKSALFMAAGIMAAVNERCGCAYDYNLKRLGGLYRGFPLLALLFFIPAISLAGIPPFSGFWAKFMLVRAGLEEGQGVIVGVALAVSVLTLFSMVKIWAEGFWKPHPIVDEAQIKAGVERTQPLRRAQFMMPLVVLVALTVVLGVLAEPVLQLSMSAAESLFNPQAYITAVLGTVR